MCLTSTPITIIVPTNTHPHRGRQDQLPPTSGLDRDLRMIGVCLDVATTGRKGGRIDVRREEITTGQTWRVENHQMRLEQHKQQGKEERRKQRKMREEKDGRKKEKTVIEI